jgi:hypothetical protein
MARGKRGGKNAHISQYLQESGDKKRDRSLLSIGLILLGNSVIAAPYSPAVPSRS